MKMKGKVFIKRLLLVAVVAALVFVCTECFEWMLAMLTGDAGCMVAVSALATGVATADQTNLGTVESSRVDADGNIERQGANRATVWDRITQMYNTKAIFDSFLREKYKSSRVTTNSFEFKYWSVAGRGIQTKVSTAVEAGAVGAVVKIKLADAHMISVDCNLMVPSYNATGPDAAATAVAAGEQSLTPLVLHVSKFEPEESQVTVFAVNANGVPTLAAGTAVYRMGTAKAETDARSEDPTQQPFDAYNYAQIRMLTLSESIYQRMADKDVNWGMTDMSDQAIHDFRITNEADALFGARREIMDPITRKVKHFMGGLTSVAGLNMVDVSSETRLTNAIVNHIAAEVFFGNNGSDRRILLMGKDAAQQMQLVETVNKQLAANNTEVVGGVKFKVFEALAGTFDMRYSPVMDLYGYADKMIAIDPDHVFRVEHKPMEEKELDLDKAGISRSKDIRLDESWTLAVTNPRCHAIVSLPKFSPSNY